jgi:hypothetical protein
VVTAPVPPPKARSLTHAAIERAGHRGVQERRGIGVAQPPQHEFREPRERGLVVADCEDHGHGFHREPACDELQRLRRRLVQPLGVIHDADERALLGNLRQQGQRRQPQEEAVRRAARPQSERSAEGFLLRRRQLVQPIQIGTAQLVQAGEHEFHLRLDARCPGHPASGCAFQQEVEQGGLADPRLSTQHQDLAAAGFRCRHEMAQPVALALSAPQAGPRAGHGLTHAA